MNGWRSPYGRSLKGSPLPMLAHTPLWVLSKPARLSTVFRMM